VGGFLITALLPVRIADAHQGVVIFRIDLDDLPEALDGIGYVAFLQQLISLAGEVRDLRVFLVGAELFIVLPVGRKLFFAFFVSAVSGMELRAIPAGVRISS
jgi:hypothetical protein